jgi:hypothetical protein
LARRRRRVRIGPTESARGASVGWRKLTGIAAALIVAIPIALSAIYRLDRAIRVGTSAVADQLCAKTFAGLERKFGRCFRKGTQDAP